MIFLFNLLITMALTAILRAAALKLGGGLALPNKRKVHISPVPKAGGIAMALGALLPVLIVDRSPFINSIMIGAWVIVAFGLMDELKNLGWVAKFSGQIAAALVVPNLPDPRIQSVQMGFLGAVLTVIHRRDAQRKPKRRL